MAEPVAAPARASKPHAGPARKLLVKPRRAGTVFLPENAAKSMHWPGLLIRSVRPGTALSVACLLQCDCIVSVARCQGDWLLRFEKPGIPERSRNASADPGRVQLDIGARHHRCRGAQGRLGCRGSILPDSNRGLQREP